MSDVRRRAGLIAYGWASRLLAMVVSLAMIRIALRLLGAGQFAVFQVMVSALAWTSLVSFGLGPALKNVVSEFRTRVEPDDTLRESAGTVILLAFAVSAIVLVLCSPLVTDLLLRRLSHDSVWAWRAFAVGGVLSVIAALGQVGTEVLYADDSAARVYTISIVTSALTFVALWVLRLVDRSDPMLILIVLGATLGPPAVSSIVTLLTARLLSFRLRFSISADVERLRALALRFWGFAVLSNLILLVDGFVISQILVAHDIVVYSIMMKVVTVGLVMFTTVIAVVWPEWTRAWELRQYRMLGSRVLRLACIGVAVCIPAAALAVALVPRAIHLWLDDSTLVPSATLIVAFIAYLAVRIWTDVHSSALMAGNRVGTASLFAILQATITAPLEYAFGRIWGAEGVIFGLLSGFMLTAAWLFPRRFYGELRRLTKGMTTEPANTDKP